jgi:hypothetical protein
MGIKVFVYNFKAYDVATDQNDIRPIKGTLEAIKNARGIVIDDTEELVDSSLLDAAEFYRPSN